MLCYNSILLFCWRCQVWRWWEKKCIATQSLVLPQIKLVKRWIRQWEHEEKFEKEPKFPCLVSHNVGGASQGHIPHSLRAQRMVWNGSLCIKPKGNRFFWQFTASQMQNSCRGGRLQVQLTVIKREGGDFFFGRIAKLQRAGAFS